MKGLLQHEYGGAPVRHALVRGGLDKPTEPPLIPLALPKDVQLNFLPDGETLERMLVEDRLDALLSIYIPPNFLQGSPEIMRLFPNYREALKNYSTSTPASSRSCTRWPCAKIFIALIRGSSTQPVRCILPSKKRSRLENFTTQISLKLGLPWLLDHVEEAQAVFGKDWWAYGIEPNRATLTALGQYVCEQGLSTRAVMPEEMFLKEFFN